MTADKPDYAVWIDLNGTLAHHEKGFGAFEAILDMADDAGGAA